MSAPRLFEPYEILLRAQRGWTRPFVQVRVALSWTAPSGHVHVVEGFHDGGDTWRARFAPDEPGRWRWHARCEPYDAGLSAEGVIDVAAATDSRGFLRATPGNAFGFAWSDGSPAFLLGDTMYNLFAYAHSGFDPAPLLARRFAQGMDLIRVRLPCSSSHRRPHRHSPWMSADVWPWGGIPQDPDFAEFNLRYFATVDRVVALCQGMGIALEFILECWLFEAPFADRERFTAEDEELWVRYLLARYGAWRAIAIWTPGNEYVYYPAGLTPLSSSDQADTRADRWLDRIARMVRSLDPHRRPIAAHTMLRPQPTFAERLAGFPAIDTILFQEWGRRDELAWTAAGIDEAIREQLDGARQTCVLAEYGYESIVGLPMIESRRHLLRDHTRRGAWRGAFHAMLVVAGFDNTWGPVMQLEPDAPGAADLIHLRTFFTRLVSFAHLCRVDGLATGGRDDLPGGALLVLASDDQDTVAIYLPLGGTATLHWPDANTRRFSWYDPRSGQLHPAVAEGAPGVYLSPDGAAAATDWILFTRRSSVVAKFP